MTTSNTVRRPLLLAAFEGWSDAACAASDAAKYLLDRYDSCIIGRIDSDEFFDFQASRPLLCTAGGRKRIFWPETAFYSVDFSSPRNTGDSEPAAMRPQCSLDHRLSGNGGAVIVALGPEPDRRWRAARSCAWPATGTSAPSSAWRRSSPIVRIRGTCHWRWRAGGPRPTIPVTPVQSAWQRS